MTTKTVTEAGFYNGEFLKAGQTYSTDLAAGDDPKTTDYDAMSKAELVVAAKSRGIDVAESDTKAEILAKLRG